MKKKMLYINTFEPPYRMAYNRELAKKYDITMLLSQPIEGLAERNPKWFSDEKRDYRRVFLKRKKFFRWQVAFEVREWIKNRDYDFVFLDEYGSMTAMYAIHCLKRMKIPFVFGVDGMLPRPQESKLAYWVKKYLLSGPSYILSPGESVDQCLMHYGVKPEKIRRFHFTPFSQADMEAAGAVSCVEKEALRRKLNITEKNVVISVGRFTYKGGYGKGYDVLMKVSQIPGDSVGFYIIGDEPTEEFVTWKKEKHLDHVHFVGFQSKDELKEFYQAADLFVLMTVEDVWGLVINEAMAYGLPVITTDHCVAGLELVHPGENGYIVPVGEVDGTAEAIRELFGDEEKMRQYGKNSRKRIEEYTSEQMAADASACFEEFLQTQKGK